MIHQRNWKAENLIENTSLNCQRNSLHPLSSFSFQILLEFSPETYTMICSQGSMLRTGWLPRAKSRLFTALPLPCPSASIGGLLSVRQEGGLGVGGYLISSVLSLLSGLWGRQVLLWTAHTPRSAQLTNGSLALRSHIFKEFKKGSQVLRIRHLWMKSCLCLFQYINSCFDGITRWLTTTFG